MRLAFPPGRKVKGAGMVVQVLHPTQENPCPVRNPAELVLMGGNPMPAARGVARGRFSSPYDFLSRNEKLAFGRLGLGKKQLRTDSDIAKAREEVAKVRRLRNRLPNPGGLGAVDSTQSQEARDLAGEFRHSSSDDFQIYDEPHMKSGSYSRLGMFAGIAVKPRISASSQVQEIRFPNGSKVRVVDKFGREYDEDASDVVLIGDKHQLYLVETQEMDEKEISLFGGDHQDPCLLGEGRGISYIVAKWHPQAEDSIRGKKVVWEHHFGEEGGQKPEVFYSRSMRRLLIRGGDYTVEGVGIKN